jgi:hypothetical protein
MDGSPARVIGWKEYVALPELGVRRVRAKIDTGARTSALDVVRYELYEDPATGQMAKLCLGLNPKRPGKRRVVCVPVLRMVVVRNTGGACEQRPLIETTLQIGPVTKKIFLTVTNRAVMRFRMILGRKALESDFVVDVSRKYLLRKTE